jgi:hypothetical protein
MRILRIAVRASVIAAVACGLAIAEIPAASGSTSTVTISASRVGASVHVVGDVFCFGGCSGELVPMVKLPGALTYTQGRARRPYSRCAVFTWDRHIRAGRTISVYFTDGVIESNVLEITPTSVGAGVRSRSVVAAC